MIIVPLCFILNFNSPCVVVVLVVFFNAKCVNDHHHDSQRGAGFLWQLLKSLIAGCLIIWLLFFQVLEITQFKRNHFYMAGLVIIPLLCFCSLYWFVHWIKLLIPQPLEEIICYRLCP